MRKYEGKIVGILGTLIFHLVAAIIFLSFQLRSVMIDRSEEFTVEFAAIEEPELKEAPITLPSSTVERILQGDEELLNIARNLSSKPDINVDPNEYIDMVKDELIRDGKLGKNNYIDEQKRQSEENGEEKLSMEDKKEEPVSEEPTESQKMAANFQGPTRIYYDLKDRIHTYLPPPIYKCQGSGKVSLLIQVNPKGIVEEAKVIGSESTTTEICLLEAAVGAALISRFNANINSPKLQAGTLTYLFVAQ